MPGRFCHRNKMGARMKQMGRIHTGHPLTLLRENLPHPLHPRTYLFVLVTDQTVKASLSISF